MAIPIKLHGAPISDPALPTSLRPGTRGSDSARTNEFLPAGYLKIDAAFDVGARARSTLGGAVERTVQTAANQVVLLEMADGVTVVTSPEKLQESLRRIDPAAVEADGTVKLSALRDRGEATRGLIGDAFGDLVSRVFTVTVGDASDPIIEAAKRKAAEWLGVAGEENIQTYAELGVSWLGTKALMWAVESLLERKPGLYRWPRGSGQSADLLNVDADTLAADAKEGPLLIFIHGTASWSTGSFGDLQKSGAEDWQALERKFGERIYAFEHRTFSQSPIENAIELVSALPTGAQINLVTHSRGGLVGDLVCLRGVSDQAIANFRSDLPEPGDVLPEERERIRRETANAHAEQQAQMRELRALLQRKQLVVQRYVRVASPARGTLLASGNFDIFLSALLTVIGRVPYLYGNPIYSAVKRIVLEIVKNRTNPKLVPGIEAMLPESPMARFLAEASPQESARVAVIAGDTDGGGLLKRLGVLFTDYAFFAGVDNDLVVDTEAMYAGIARHAGARALFTQSPTTSHFSYFSNEDTRAAMRDWLVADAVEPLVFFKALPGDLSERTLEEEKADTAALRRSRGGETAEAALPIAVVLPGIMGSHLWRNESERVWFRVAGLVAGGLGKLAWSEQTGTEIGDGITAERLFDDAYGDLCDYLLATHRVERFPYDWRLPLDILADRLEAFLRRLCEETQNSGQPIRILAHSMGGLVTRAVIHKLSQRQDPLWDDLMARDGARFIMLGTPNQGAHSMVEALIGKSDTLRSLARIDVTNDLQSILDIICEFRGALQLLPKPGFADVGDAQFDDYYTAARWSALKEEMKDFWFGDKVAAVPSGPALNQAKWLWDCDGAMTPALPEAHQEKTIYVHGCAPNTACGIQQIDGRWKMIGTFEGDGTVTWKSGAIGGIGKRYYMDAIHGDLANTDEYFAALDELLRNGATDKLMERPPEARGAEAAKPRAYEAGPPLYPMPDEAAHALTGRPRRRRLTARALPALKVAVKAMDLRFVDQPIMVGHYEQDAIAGPESIIDRELVNNALSERYNLGLYAGPLGTAVVVLRLPNEAERLRGSSYGAVVTGLGAYDGTLSANRLTEAVRTGALRYLLQYFDCSGVGSGDIELSTLLLGYNSSANLTIQASLESLVRGVIEANRKFQEATRQTLRIGSLDIIELYLDTAISAMRYLRGFAEKSNSEARGLGARLEVPEELEQHRSARPRLDDSRAVGQWPRIIITDADHSEEDLPPEKALELRRRAGVAERLKFVHVGQRARAETIVQQRQPGLVEKLVEQQISDKAYRPDFSRTLFQLMIPHDFKDAARQLNRVVLVVDGYTANLPWEMMLAEDQPLAVRSPVIRQLVSSKFRRQVRQSVQPFAYVIGNPSTGNFYQTFPNPHRHPSEGLAPLSGAQEEAGIVVEALRRYGYDVEQAIGTEFDALEVINPLYQKPYRILHIAAHGVFEEKAADGRSRSGVVLSDGLLLGAAEIGQMEIVPDLVFLNCCHLAKLSPLAVAYNRLAYSIARELIEIGVRCVVAAGWAVDDDAACTFAEVFYKSILHDKLQFGDAVFAARCETYRKHGETITWGAYQAYGDAGWRIDPRDGAGTRGGSTRSFVSPDELIDAMRSIRTGISRRRESMTRAAARETAAQLEALVRRSPGHWRDRPAVAFELAETYAALGAEFFEKACSFYSAAIVADDKAGRVPIKAVEQLANTESKLGEQIGAPELIDRAIARLQELDRLVAATVDYASGRKVEAATTRANIERRSLAGSAYKRKAAMFARAIIDPDAANRQESIKNFREAIRQSIAAYQSAAGSENEAGFEPYPGLNWLALEALNGDYRKGVATCLLCGKRANEEFLREANVWNAVMAAEAYLVETLCNGRLSKAGAAGDQALDDVWRRYSDALANVRFAPKDLDSVTMQLCVLALFFQARSAFENQAGRSRAQRIVAERLRKLAERIQPGSCNQTAPSLIRAESRQEPVPRQRGKRRKR